MQRINQAKTHNFPKTKQAWSSFINQTHNEGVDQRRPIEFQWAYNTAYYKGFQQLLFNPLTNVLVRDYESEEFVINRIAPIAEQKVAKIIRTKPILTVLPDKLDPQTIKAAQLSEDLLKHLWKTDKMDDKLRLASLYMVLTGSAFFKTVWNPAGGVGIQSDQDEKGNLQFGEQGDAKTTTIFTGDIEVHPRSPFAILAQSGTKDIRSAPWIIERTFMTVDEAKAEFKELNIDRVISTREDMTNFERFVMRLGSPTFTGLFKTSQDPLLEKPIIKDLDLVIRKEFWLKPNSVYPKGVLATVVGDQLVQFDEWPYNHNEYPFVKIDEHQNPFGFYGDSTITRLIPIQRHYNAARTQMSKNAALMANGKWWAPKGHGMAEDALTDEEGEVVETNPNLPKPSQLEIAPLPNYVIENMSQDITDMRDVSGEREASQLPFPGITASVALETAAELSNVDLVPTLRSIESALIDLGRQQLMLANQFYIDERIVKIVGPNKQINIVKFNNLDLLHQTDVSIQVESGLGQSKAASQQKLIDLWDRRVIQDPEDFMNAFVTGDIDVILKKKDNAQNIVIEQIEKMKQGENPVVSQFDNHILHVRMLSQFIQTPEFRRLPPDRQQIGVQTLQQHLSFLQPAPEQQNPAAVGTPFGAQVTEGP